MKLPGHRPGLPGKVISFYILPLDPAYKAELAGHVPVTGKATYHLRCRASPVPYMVQNKGALWK